MSKLRKMASGSAALLMAVSWALLARDDPKRYELIVPPAEILAGPKIYLAPTSVLQKLSPGGYSPADEYLASSGEVWQPEVAEYLRKEFGKKKISAELAPITAEDFKAKLEAVLRSKGIDGVYDSATGNVNEELYQQVMQELATQYGGVLLAPHLIEKVIKAKQLWTGEKSPKAKWDGVSRKLETGHHSPTHHSHLRGEDVPVLSLRLEGYSQKGRLFWSDGGFDVVFKMKVGHTPFFYKVKQQVTDADELFGSKNRGHREEAIEEAYRPLF
jgi:hypothetical protein